MQKRCRSIQNNGSVLYICAAAVAGNGDTDTILLMIDALNPCDFMASFVNKKLLKQDNIRCSMNFNRACDKPQTPQSAQPIRV